MSAQPNLIALTLTLYFYAYLDFPVYLTQSMAYLPCLLCNPKESLYVYLITVRKQ